VRGFVESLDEIFSSVCALLVPLLAAGGLKLKILTALYYGLPIVATEVSVDGIPMQDGVHYIRENAIERFAAHMARLCDRSYNAVMSRNASDLFREHYSKEAVFREYDELLRT
jgi:glycosyltransferase involved in cell wall biosynthesis